jgi:hypothetical protein
MALSDLIPDPNAPPINMPGMQGGLPQIGTPLLPLVSQAPGPRSGQEQRAMQQANTPTGLSSLSTPAQGFWQHVRKIAEGIGNVAGDVVAPSTMALIPGTQLNREIQHGQGVRELAGLQAQDSDDAKQASANTTAASENTLRGAQTANLTSETNERDNPKAVEPSLAQAYAHAVQSAIKNGQDPDSDPIVQHMRDAITDLNKQPAPKGGEHVNVVGSDGKTPIIATYDPITHKTIGPDGKEIANPVPYEKPATVNVNAGAAQDRLAKNDVLKAYQPTLDSAERMNVMTESYEKAVKDHDQQAMLNLLANHLGMTMGLQKGSRITKDIVNEAQHSQPWLQGMEAKFDPKTGYLSGVTLSPNQMHQMVSLGQERYAEDAKKSRATAQYLGSKDDGPERTPGRATINYYLGQTGGDPVKAKALAAQDGWSVK